MFQTHSWAFERQGSHRLTLPHWLAAGTLERVVQELRTRAGGRVQIASADSIRDLGLASG